MIERDGVTVSTIEHLMAALYALLIDDLRALERAGIDIIACGTCLNFFELADQLAVGRVTDMLEIAGLLASAGRAVRP